MRTAIVADEGSLPRIALFALAVVVSLVACSNDRGSQAHDSVVSRTPTCIATTEAAGFVCSGGTAARTGDTLRIRLASQTAKLFVDSNGEVGSHYQYLGRLGSRGYHLVEQFGGDHPPFFLLVQPQSGRDVTVTAMPVLSRDGARFAAATPDWDCAESPDQRLAIWRFADSLPVREWEIAPLLCTDHGATSGWAALEPVWRARDTLAFTKVEQPTERRRAELVVWDGRVWRLAEPRR